MMIYSKVNLSFIASFFILLNWQQLFHNSIFQGVFHHSGGMFVGWISWKCLSHKVQNLLCEWSSFLWNSKEGSFCCWCCFHFLHFHRFEILLYQLLECKGKFPTISWRRWDWCWHGNLQMSLLVNHFTETSLP